MFLIGDRRMLFTEDVEIASSFGQVTGLEAGTQVRLAGLQAGEVLEIEVPPQPSGALRGPDARAGGPPPPDSHRFDVRHPDRRHRRERLHQIGPATMASSSRAACCRDGIRLEFADLIEEGRDTFRGLVSKEGGARPHRRHLGDARLINRTVDAAEG
ncbi:MAG: hypothetical protein R2712_28995 [Vicinamibacterales bacterium]